jgi:DNA-binding CsgD family transcriptional regulator
LDDRLCRQRRLRAGVDGPFTAAEVTDVRQLTPVATTTLRRALGRVTYEASHRAPVVILLDGEGGVVSMTEGGEQVLKSYGLTPRETEIVLLLARGLSAKEIAAELAISGHTVRDHVKTIYAKAGVGNRGELVATLFANHVLDRFHDSVTHFA